MNAIIEYFRKLMSSLFGSTGRMMSCAEFESFILDYLDDDLTPEQRAIFERHIAACDACRDYLVGYQQTVALGQTVFTSPEAPVPREVPEELVEGILKARSS
ncbi:MAG: zf-HC2 domain-containing protein [Deltaproteobacteria bacterium]|nr:zf-HC2 domain-containing protein [Deltaproteobacteria bacterium]